ncbi:MAG: prolyl oligopeptidase family serine peptidase [Verrucomicrobia bacterium]|nr:prolyl oligopeptidase family serine peptidase [Verrucomicrobiota bacterium]
MKVSLPRRLLLPLLLAALADGLAAEAPPGNAIDETVAAFFRPYQHDLAALSPDGHFVAMDENLPGKPPAIVIVDLDDRSSQTHVVDSSREQAVVQLHWVSPTRLVFTTRLGALGALDLPQGGIRALLTPRDFEGFVPPPEFGPPRYTSALTPDQSADPSTRSTGPRAPFLEVALRDALAQERVTGDLFNGEARRLSSRVLRPFILGSRPGSPHLLQVEVRDDGDLFTYRSTERDQVNVPGNAFLQDANAASAQPVLRTPLPGEIIVYSVTRRPPPLAVIELDATNGKWRELTREDDWRRTWLDHQGRLRLALQQDGRRFRYLYHAAGGGSWVPLDSVVKTPAPLGFTVEPAGLLAPRSVPLGFDAGGDVLYLATNVGRDTFGLRALNLRTGRLEELEAGHDRYDLITPTALVAGDAIRFDPSTHALAGIRFSTAHRQMVWFDPAMTQLQARLAKQLAPLSVELREWTPDRARFLIDTSSAGDPGGFSVADVTTGKLIRCGDRAPWLTADRRSETHAFDFKAADGRRLAGFLTRPRSPRLTPPPLLVYFHDGPWFADGPQFNRGAQALAALGFAVLQLNHRGSGGLGRAHLAAAGDGLDRAVLADVQAVLERGKDGALGFNPKRVAAFGNGIGGYLAVRLAQLAPGTFRCAVAINAPGDLADWRAHPEAVPSFLGDLRPHVFGTDGAKLRDQSALAAAPTTRVPVLVVHGETDTYVPIAMGRELYQALKPGAPETAFLNLPGAGHGGWSEETTAKLFAELGRFFNATIYRYSVDVSNPEVVR